MNKPSNKYPWLGYIAAPVLFFIISIIYFAPQYDGKALNMHDVTQYVGSSKDIEDHYSEFGEDPQWTGNSFGGMPSYMIDFKVSSWIIRHASKLPVRVMGEPAVLMFITMLCFWLMLLLWGINPWVGIIPALAYGLSTYTILIIGAGHISKVWAIAYAPLLIGAIVYTYRSRNVWLGATLAALAASLEISANHPQITYYFLFVIAAIVLNELYRIFAPKTYSIKAIGKRRFATIAILIILLSGILAVAAGLALDSMTIGPVLLLWLMLLFPIWVVSVIVYGAVDAARNRVQFIKERGNEALKQFGKATAALALAAIFAVGSNFATLYYTAHHSGDTTRGGSELVTKSQDTKGLDLQYATAWSYGRTESFNMLIPDLMGGSSYKGFPTDGDVAKTLARYNARSLASQLPTYWGDQPGTAGPTYIGAIVLFLAVMALFTLDGRKKWWILAVSLFGIFLSWGSNMMWFTELCFKVLPGYNKFRAVSTALIIVQWSAPLLAALVLSQLWNAELPKKKIVSGVKWAAGITGGIALFFALFGGWLFDFTSAIDSQLPDDVVNAMRSERMAMLSGDAWRSLLFVLLGAGTVLLLTYSKIKKQVFAATMCVIVCLDLIPVDLRFLSHKDFMPKRQTEIKATAADKEILKDSELGFRVANKTVSTFSDATTSYFHRSIGGYHGAKLRRYQDIIDYHLAADNDEVYNMLNTKYFIEQDKNTGAVIVRKNDAANGAAWFADKIYVVDNANEEITALSYIDTKHEAVVDKRFADALSSTDYHTQAGSAIRLTDYKVNHLTYEYESPSDAVAIFSEIYYDKGWSAYIDGKKAPYFRADYILRGMELPAGKHTVEFRFRAPNFAVVSAITLVCSIIILAALTITLILTIINRKKNGQNRKQHEKA